MLLGAGRASKVTVAFWGNATQEKCGPTGIARRGNFKSNRQARSCLKGNNILWFNKD